MPSYRASEIDNVDRVVNSFDEGAEIGVAWRYSISPFSTFTDQKALNRGIVEPAMNTIAKTHAFDAIDQYGVDACKAANMNGAGVTHRSILLQLNFVDNGADISAFDYLAFGMPCFQSKRPSL